MSATIFTRLLVAATIAGVCAFFSPQLPRPVVRSHSTVGSDFHDLRPTSSIGTDAADETGPDGGVVEPEVERQRDLRGNEVLDAVAQFKFDGGGSLYEVHAPRVELPRLGSPLG
jgi:hypothetical protein